MKILKLIGSCGKSKQAENGEWIGKRLKVTRG